jgi:hypothetical protein
MSWRVDSEGLSVYADAVLMLMLDIRRRPDESEGAIMAIVIKLVKNELGDEDMSLEDGIFEMSENGEAAAVQMKERLLLDQNEAQKSPIVDTVKDPLSGTGWETIIFDSSKSKEEKELEIKRVIFSTPGIIRITYWNWSQVVRTLHLNYKVDSLWGELEFNEVVQL